MKQITIPTTPSDIELYAQQILFVDHEIDMKNWLPAVDSKLIDDIVKMVIHFSNKAVDDCKRDISLKLCDKFKEEISGIIYDTINKKEIEEVGIKDL